MSAPFVWNKDYVYAFGKSFMLIKNEEPKVPKRPWATNISASGLQLNWELQGESDLLVYSIERKYRRNSTCPELTSPFINLGAWENHWLDTFPGVPAGDCNYGPVESETTIKYTLRAMDSASNISEPSLTLLVRPAASYSAPASPGWITAAALDEAVSLTWASTPPAASEVRGWEIERKIGAGSFGSMNTAVLSEARFYDAGLTNGTTYTYRVRTVDTADRRSVWRESAPLVPADTTAPGPPVGVVAEPEPAQGQIRVTWARGLEPDLQSYKVYRSDTEQGAGTHVGTVPASAQNLFLVDSSAASGITYYYYVVALDDVPVMPNESVPSARASARSRRADMTPPVLDQAQFVINDMGTTTDIGNAFAEDDDVIKIDLSWSTGSGGTAGYAIYRKAGNESVFSRIATTYAGVRAYSDTTVNKGSYTYFVACVQNTAFKDESGASNMVTVTRLLSPDKSVRNLRVVDARIEYQTQNDESRAAYVFWSRVSEPDVLGYNVYRTCRFGGGCQGWGSMETFACEPVWTRINQAILPPTNRAFADSSIGGLQGCFLYAVRPVAGDLTEGQITKAVEADLHGSDTSESSTSATHSVAATSITGDTADMPSISISSHFDAIQAAPPRDGTLNTDGAPQSPTNVQRVVYLKPSIFPKRRTKVARVTWDMPLPLPRDLKGFHVEAAGSPSGPWKRITKNPVAWWERRYSLQGVDVEMVVDPVGAPASYQFLAHREACISFRVLAVDESGNESPATNANNPTSGCPATPAAPTNLTATFLTSPSRIRLEWTHSPNATEYFVNRLGNSYGHIYFYPTQRQAAAVGQQIQVYDETGTDRISEPIDYNTGCPYIINASPGFRCELDPVEVYFVTARGASGGESPSSNLVFVNSYTPPYAKGPAPQAPLEGIANNTEVPSSLLACWQPAEGAALPGDHEAYLEFERQLAGATPTELGFNTAPMRTLGTVTNPPWSTYDLHTDHLGTVRLITNASGFITSQHDYQPFGEPVVNVAQGYNTHEFTGHERDAETGLDYMFARYYSSSLDRFLSVDPSQKIGRNLTNPQRWNRYAYTLNNPVSFIDPDGREVRYADAGLQKRFTGEFSKSEMVRTTLDRYTGPGKPDLLVQRGDAGTDKRTGEKATGVFKPNMDFTHNDTVRKDSDIFPATGKNLKDVSLKDATLTIDNSVKPGSAQEKDVALHELGHADKAASDPQGYMEQDADDQNTGPDGKPLPHDDRPAEKGANEYRDAAKKEIRR